VEEGGMANLRLVAGCLICLGLLFTYVSCSHKSPTGVDGPNTIRVASDRSGDAPTVQEALKIAKDSDVVELADGVYSGPGNEDIDFLGKRVTLRSQSGDPDRCEITILHTVYRRRAFVFQSGEDSLTVVRGIKVNDGTGGYWPQPDRRSLSPGSATYGGAIICRGGASPLLIDCVFVHNAATEGGVALCIEGASPSFVGCTFFDNAGDGLFTGFEASAVFDRALIAFNSGSVLPDYETTIAATFRCSDIYGNWSDWQGTIAGMLGVNGNISRDPLFADEAGGNLRLSAGSPCLPESTGCGLIGALGAQ
jgi:hypothetical protein